mgnify:CR=1 FL=1
MALEEVMIIHEEGATIWILQYFDITILKSYTNRIVDQKIIREEKL